MNQVIVAPSLLDVKEENLSLVLSEIKESEAQWVHFDVMDGEYVHNTSFPIGEFSRICRLTDLVKDVHIMVNDPLSYAKAYVPFGANYLTFHIETLKSEEEVNELIDFVHSLNCKVGIALSPDIEVESIIKYLHKIDLVLVMSVHPGKGGQSFMPEALNKIIKLNFIKNQEPDLKENLLIEVDGGINKNTAKSCAEAGCNVLVSGSYIFSGDIKERIFSLLR